MNGEECDSGARMFTYTYFPGASKPEQHLHLPVNVLTSRAKHMPELAARVMNHHNIPCFVDSGK